MLLHNRLQYSIHDFYMHLKTKICVAHFIVIFALFQWFGTKPSTSVRYDFVNMRLKMREIALIDIVERKF